MAGWFAWVRGRRTGAAAPVSGAFDPFELRRAISTQDRASIVCLAAGPAGERRDRFVERLASTGGAALAPLLDETEIAEVARRYACHDRRADDARARFDRASRAANSLVLVAALANAASLGIATTFPAGAGPLWVNPCIVTLGILSTLAGATAATLLFFISGGKLLERFSNRVPSVNPSLRSPHPSLARHHPTDPVSGPAIVLSRFKAPVPGPWFSPRSARGRRMMGLRASWPSNVAHAVRERPQPDQRNGRTHVPAGTPRRVRRTDASR